MRKIWLPAIFFLLVTLSCRLPTVSQNRGQESEVRSSSPLSLAQEPASAKPASTIMLVYPKDNSTINAASTFLIGSCPASSTLTCNGASVKLNRQGFFAHVVPLHRGTNTFVLAETRLPSAGDDNASGRTTPPLPSVRKLTVKRDALVKPLAPWPLKIDPASLRPAEDTALTAGDILPLSARGSPGGRMVVYLGGRKIALSPVDRGQKRSPVYRGLDAAYGVAYQRLPPSSPDLYAGFYKISAEDRWQKVKPRYVLSKNNRVVQALAPSAVTILQQPRIAQTLHDDTVVRLAPNEARTTPLVSGVRLIVDGWQGSSMRCLLSPRRHVFIRSEDLTFQDGPAIVPSSVVRTVNLKEEPGGARIVVPLSQRLPYEIEQQMRPNRLILRIYGATADTDWITPAPELEGTLIESINWRQTEDRVYEIVVQLDEKRQWGFWANYDDTSLNLHVKGRPNVAPVSGSLKGLVVCLDPGHGGSETGSIGPSGVHESTVNLGIALRLRELLLQAGSKVIMTRQSDDETVSLSERVNLAIAQRADLLISIHNNALPDGRDPWRERGTSSYWYHPQAIELARHLKKALVTELGFPDFGTFYQNLALTRPSNMPAVLVEVGFMINPDEYALLIEPSTQQKAAQALYAGIRSYLGQDYAETEASSSPQAGSHTDE